MLLLLLLSRCSRVQLCDPIDGLLLGSSVPEILQARTLEWMAISFSNAWKWKVKVKSLSHVWLLATPWTAAYQAPPSMGFSRQEYWSGVPLPSPKEIYEGAKSSLLHKTVVLCQNIKSLNLSIQQCFLKGTSRWARGRNLYITEVELKLISLSNYLKKDYSRKKWNLRLFEYQNGIIKPQSTDKQGGKGISKTLGSVF